MKHFQPRHWRCLISPLIAVLWQNASFATTAPEPAVLVIGASYANGSPPFDDALVAPLGGMAVNFGSYLSVGNALVRNQNLSGFVINEAQSGATTFDRPACTTSTCGPHGWHGYKTQFRKALARVTVPDRAHPGQVLGYNADHVIISIPNDCLHAEAFGIPPNEATACDLDELDAVVTRLIEVGETALSYGIVPIFEAYPAWRSLDWPLMQALFGVAWTIDESSYAWLRQLQHARVVNELPEAIFLDPWRGFQHIGDGIHPSPMSAMHAARKYAQVIIESRAR